MKIYRWLSLGAITLCALGTLAFVGTSSMDSESVWLGFTPRLFEVRHSFNFYGVDIAGEELENGQIARNETLADILTHYAVPARYIRQLSYIPHNLFDVRKILPGKDYTVIRSRDSLRTAKAFIYEPNAIDYVVFHFSDTLYVDVCQRKVEHVRKSLSGVIQNSLSETIQQSGNSIQLTNDMVDIFAWQIDFQHLAKGDVFKVVYQEDQVNGEPVGIGKIVTAHFLHNGKDYYAYSFDQGDGIDYFNEEGNSLRKALLKYPIEFTRISSRYSWHRFHPVEKRFKPHLGTDFAAPTGTPIRSVGDGVVVEATYSKFNGNFVKIRHNATYSTQYLHMSKIAPGMRPGVHVKQGQWIGNVGSTGLATGPHLCYRFWKNGVQVDALRVELPAATPIKPEFREAFTEQVNSERQLLNAVQPAEPLAAKD